MYGTISPWVLGLQAQRRGCLRAAPRHQTRALTMVLEAELVPTSLNTGQGEAGSWLGRSLQPLRVKCHHTHASSVPFPTPTISCRQPTEVLICCCSVASHIRLSVTTRTAACQAPLSFTVSQSLLTFMSTESVMLSNHLILCRLLLLLPSIFLAQDTLSLLPGVMAILSLACESLAISFPSPFKSLSHLANIYCAY